MPQWNLSEYEFARNITIGWLSSVSDNETVDDINIGHMSTWPAISTELNISTTTTTTTNNEWSTLQVEGVRKRLLELCLTLSCICMLFSFLSYCFIPELRTIPGKCLMGLIVSEFITNILAIAALQCRPKTTTCFFIGIAIHYFFLTMITWSNVIAYDIVKKFKYPNQKLRHFVRYLFYVYLVPMILVLIALIFEQSSNIALKPFKPLYGQRICAISGPIARLIFMTAPTYLSLLSNLAIFVFAIYKIKKAVDDIYDGCNHSSTIRQRCIWYVKLSILLGLSSVLGMFGMEMRCCHSFKFITFLVNSLHGTFIFIAFTCKRSICRLLFKRLSRFKSITFNEPRRSTRTTLEQVQLQETICGKSHKHDSLGSVVSINSTPISFGDLPFFHRLQLTTSNWNRNRSIHTTVSTGSINIGIKTSQQTNLNDSNEIVNFTI